MKKTVQKQAGKAASKQAAEPNKQSEKHVIGKAILRFSKNHFQHQLKTSIGKKIYGKLTKAEMDQMLDDII